MKPKNILYLCDSFTPLKNSAAIQNAHLVDEFLRLGHRVTVITADTGNLSAENLQETKHKNAVRVTIPFDRNAGYVSRLMFEICLPFLMVRTARNSCSDIDQIDMVIWYSPSIFVSIAAAYFKRKTGGLAYLILRDVFPDWAWDLGLIKSKLLFRFFSLIARFQYRTADVIGIQSKGNAKYVNAFAPQNGRVEVLHNWLAKPRRLPCRVNLDSTVLSGKTCLLYTGNLGVAQAPDILIEFAKRLGEEGDYGLVLLGRGSERQRLMDRASEERVRNILFLDEIPHDELSGLCDQCSLGIVTLDQRHRSHNIPGKLLTYVSNRLPVFAVVNANNDLVDLIHRYKVGVVSNYDVNKMLTDAMVMLQSPEGLRQCAENCDLLADELFSVNVAATQIIRHLQCGKSLPASEGYAP